MSVHSLVLYIDDTPTYEARWDGSDDQREEAIKAIASRIAEKGIDASKGELRFFVSELVEKPLDEEWTRQMHLKVQEYKDRS